MYISRSRTALNILLKSPGWNAIIKQYKYWQKTDAGRERYGYQRASEADEYESLTKTFEGQITLNEKPPHYVPAGSAEPKTPNKKQDTLQNIINKINERFEGDFTDADRVILEGIYQMFMKDEDVSKFRQYAKDNSTEMFVESLFPDKFRDIVTQCFLDNNEAFRKLFNDPAFYKQVEEVMAKEMYRSLRKSGQRLQF